MLDFLKEKKVFIGIAICIVLLVGVYILNSNSEYQKIEESQEILAKEELEEKKDEINENGDIVVVHIAGAVKTPGVVKLKIGSRVEDQTTPNMIQRISGIFERNALISKGI